MLFNSIHFFIFLPIVIVLYYLLPHRLRWPLLFASGCWFYMALYPPYIFILFVLIAIDYISARAMEKHPLFKKKILIISILSNIGILVYFKYTGFFYQELKQLAEHFQWKIPYYQHDVILPVGLSFHTFQSLSYTIDVYRNKLKAEKHLGHFANYVLFFPQMVAGPIERFERLGFELQKERHFEYKNLAHGFRLIIWGLMIKMCVADQVALFCNPIFEHPEQFGLLDTWLGVLLFSIQIYADFYGYSTIACGSAIALGIPILNNFNQPYFAHSIQAFWSRWHISLSTWFRDYVYIPLGGNRVSKFRNALNIFIVFGISGLWHGANTTFIIWGLLHGIFYLIEQRFLPTTPSNTKLFRIVQIPFTFLLVSFAWIFFRASNFHIAGQIIQHLFQENGPDHHTSFPIELIAPTGVFIVIELLLQGKRFDSFIGSFTWPIRWVTYSIFCVLILLFSGINSLPFIYFQF